MQLRLRSSEKHAVPIPSKADLPSSPELIAYVDGASRGNPGPASYGVVIQDPQGKTIETLSGFLGEVTNNVAEYKALLAALEYASRSQTERLKICCDSELVAKQMQGLYRVQSPDLKPLYERARALAGQFKLFRIEHVPRERNHQADLLANQALDHVLTGKGKAPAPKTHSFRAIVRSGKLMPLFPLPELEEGEEYEVRASKRLSTRSQKAKS